ncbi:MAG: hypothetical protein J6B92_12905 [Paraprevotella sp.]|nr:hypothetical protein [Paraprevotella sp.]
MKNFRSLLFLMVVGMPFLATSCEKDDNYDADKDSYDSGKEVQTPSLNISKPTFEKYLTTTTTSEVSMRCRFNNGGDTWNNMTCTVHWRRYSSKPSTTPKASDMSNHESMRQYASTSISTTFDKTHTGFSGGTYVYYYFECKNSKYTTKTDITFCIVKR